MKTGENSLPMSQLIKRIHTLEAQGVAMRHVIAALLSVLRDGSRISDNFINNLQKGVCELDEQCKKRLGRDRPEWEWHSRAAAVSFLLSWFESKIHDPGHQSSKLG